MLEPGHDRALGNKVHYEKELQREAERQADKMLRGDDGSPEYEVQPTDKWPTHHHGYYQQMCRNDVPQDPKVVATLRCRYKTNSPFLKLAPLKYEEASLSPYIVVFHEVLADSEIDVIKKLAKPKVKYNKNEYGVFRQFCINPQDNGLNNSIWHNNSAFCFPVPTCDRTKSKDWRFGNGNLSH